MITSSLIFSLFLPKPYFPAIKKALSLGLMVAGDSESSLFEVIQEPNVDLQW
jgi:hypothetical protein